VQKINNKYIKSIVYQALKEDLEPSGDITTKNINDKKVLAKIITGQNCIIGGINFAKETFKILDKKIIFKSKIKDGKEIKKGKIIAILKGSAKSILKAERVALNFIGLVSGVATITNKFVKKINGKYTLYCSPGHFIRFNNSKIDKKLKTYLFKHQLKKDLYLIHLI